MTDTASESLPGYSSMPEAGTAYTRNGTVAAVRVTGPFLVRGRSSVDYIKDGWLVTGEDGYLFGVEDAVFASQFTVVP